VIPWRVVVVAALWLLPVVVAGVLGLYALWKLRLFWWTWWLGPACWLLAWWLTRVWQPSLVGAEENLAPAALWSTPQDAGADRLIAGLQQRVAQRTAAELLDLNTARADVEELARTLAAHYHPEASQPLEQVTVPELLAVVRLALEDLEEWLPATVPGSRLLTIQRWKQLRNAPEWLARLRDLSWAASVVWNPANLLRLLVGRWAGQQVTGALQTELVATAYLRFLDRVGFYLKELNSGRLRRGAAAYRATFGADEPLAAPGVTQEPAESTPTEPVSLVLVGQTSSGKSSVINALVGTQVARVDLLPETREVTRYQVDSGFGDGGVGDRGAVTPGDGGARVTLLDTPGYGAVETTATQRAAIETALRGADVVLLVLAAHVPAREADVRQLDELRRWYASQPRLRPPPIVAVLTHIDLLPPPLIWQPPCDWREPQTSKERSVQGAVEAVRQLLGSGVVDVVPVCAHTDPARQWGVLEELAPALTLLLPAGQATSLVRMFEQDVNRNRWRDVARQTMRLGGEVWRAWVHRRLDSSDGGR
jgi:predicted GTPase